jgi:hypothetical protein
MRAAVARAVVLGFLVAAAIGLAIVLRAARHGEAACDGLDIMY